MTQGIRIHACWIGIAVGTLTLAYEGWLWQAGRTELQVLRITQQAMQPHDASDTSNRLQHFLQIEAILSKTQVSSHVIAELHYDIGTLYLEQARSFWLASGVLEYARVNALLTEAKRHLRNSIVLNPENADARFNLEYAWRITPPPKDIQDLDWKAQKGSLFSTLPGIAGGGP